MFTSKGRGYSHSPESALAQEALLYPSEVLGLLRTGSFLPPHWKPAACFKEVQAVLLETPRGSHTGKTDVQTSE